MQKMRKIALGCLLVAAISAVGSVLLWRSGYPVTNGGSVTTGISAKPTATSALVEGAAAASSARPDGKINLNTATARDLNKLEGIGPATVEKIIDYRSVTPFKVIEDIKKIDGIGEQKFQKIKEFICVD